MGERRISRRVEDWLEDATVKDLIAKITAHTEQEEARPDEFLKDQRTGVMASATALCAALGEKHTTVREHPIGAGPHRVLHLYNTFTVTLLQTLRVCGMFNDAADAPRIAGWLDRFRECPRCIADSSIGCRQPILSYEIMVEMLRWICEDDVRLREHVDQQTDRISRWDLT